MITKKNSDKESRRNGRRVEKIKYKED